VTTVALLPPLIGLVSAPLLFRRGDRRRAPVAALAASTLVVAIVPLGGVAAPLSFPGDFALLVGLFALARFASRLAGLDPGASSEPVLLLALAVLARASEQARAAAAAPIAAGAPPFSLAALVGGVDVAAWRAQPGPLALLAVSLLLVAVAEARSAVHAPSRRYAVAALLAGLAVPLRGVVAWLGCAATLGGVAAVALASAALDRAWARRLGAGGRPLLVAALAAAVAAALFTLYGAPAGVGRG
jgi:hypothetical protein